MDVDSQHGSTEQAAVVNGITAAAFFVDPSAPITCSGGISVGTGFSFQRGPGAFFCYGVRHVESRSAK